MGQQEIINVLRSEPTKWFTRQEIEEKLNMTFIGSCIKKIRKCPEVIFVPPKRGGRAFLYKYNSDCNGRK